MRFRVTGFLVAGWFCVATVATAGVPSIKEDCTDRSNRPVSVRYDAAVPVFAEVRSARAGSSSTGPMVIYINPDVYFVGRETQQWLYRRQCAHILLGHAVVRDGERGRNLRDEEQADCDALAAMARTYSAPASLRTLRASIESDIQRATRDDNWHRLLPGPQRRISLDRCPG